MWPNEFSFENITESKSLAFSKETLEDSYKELNKIYQKDHKKSKMPKKAKQAWC